MSQYYQDYVWKEGIPYGLKALNERKGLSYKIAMDPYRKRIAIESYLDLSFQSVIYDSALLDFRHLKPAEQTAWQKVLLSENQQQISAAIYNQDDRLVLIESYFFENKLCRNSIATSGHGIVLTRQQMFYTSLGDKFNGVVLFDNNNHPVMFKRYEWDESNGQFSQLVDEVWDGGQIPTLISPLIAH